MTDTVLIIDDEASIRESLSGILADEGFHPLAADSGESGLALLAHEKIDLVLLDIWMQGMDGMETLDRIQRNFSSVPVVMISGHGSIDTAVQATKKGAFDFIEKPLSYDKVILSIQNGIRLARLEEENRLLRTSHEKPDLTGSSAAIEEVRFLINRVAPTDSWVLIRGEHGTGKEVVAQAIHRQSANADAPMIEVNCAAIPEELIESELFGHEKGSFTGAHASRRGKFDQADGGILFLDEIGDMSLKTQAKILRILQEQKFERVGGARTISVNVRVLAATNKNLEEEINRGTFRADLFWRLNVVPIVVPPLRDRAEDIPLLVNDFLSRFSAKGLGEKIVSTEAMSLLQQHIWSGNVRELKNVIERLVILHPEPVITAAAVSSLLGMGGQPVPGGNQTLQQVIEAGDYRQAKREFERLFISSVLKNHGNNVALTAKEIGMERSHLHKKIKSLDISVE